MVTDFYFSGLKAYVFQVAKMRLKVGWRYMSMKIEIMGATINEEDGTFCLHWKFFGVPFKLRRILRISRWMPWTISNTIQEEVESVFLFNPTD